jgi:hypothetical protein
MDDQGQTAAAAPPPPNPPPAPAAAPPPSPAAIVQDALAKLNHPTNLDLQSRLAAIEHSIRVFAQQLMPLLPTE